ncbi:MAG: hypothetical protein JJE46_09380 [Acidimicrobiia bacterium]|nr:hypothetical protein [Acidimicrobiia bacterium]
MTSTVGFLHTAAVHESTFTGLVEDVAPGMHTSHLVDESLLADARTRGGVDEDIGDRLLARLREAAIGADVIVCTCSTISGAAEARAEQIGVPVIRVDRPMAEAAVAAGARIAVVAALASTLGPTTELLREVATSAGSSLQITEYTGTDAWASFERGDQAGYLRSIAATVDAIPGPVDAIVLAQASMAGAVERCRADVPVFSSPRLAVERAVHVISI